MGFDSTATTRYTLEDFKGEPLENRLKMLTTIVASPISTALLYQSLVPRRVYTSGRQLLESLLEYLGIPYEEFKENKNLYKDCIPVSLLKDYQGYLNDLINAKLVAKAGPKIYGFALTDFGIIAQEFLGYVFKGLAKYEINSTKLFGNSPKNAIKILNYIYENGETSIDNILKSLDSSLSETVLKRILSRFKMLGLIEYESRGIYRRGPQKRYIINRDKLINALKCLEDEECKRNIRQKYHMPTNIAKIVIDYLMENDFTSITLEELTKALKGSYNSIYIVVKWLTHEGVLSAERLPPKRLHSIRITKKGKEVYEEIIRPILEVAEDPDKITKYRAKLSDEDKWKLFSIYCTYRLLRGKREDLILYTLQKLGDLTIKEIANITGLNIDTIRRILIKLKKEGIVKKDENNRWYISDPRYKSI